LSKLLKALKQSGLVAPLSKKGLRRELKGKGPDPGWRKDKKADDIRKELQALGAWKPSKVKQTRKKLRKK